MYGKCRSESQNYDLSVCHLLRSMSILALFYNVLCMSSMHRHIRSALLYVLSMSIYIQFVYSIIIIYTHVYRQIEFDRVGNSVFGFKLPTKRFEEGKQIRLWKVSCIQIYIYIYLLLVYIFDVIQLVSTIYCVLNLIITISCCI